MTFEEKDDLAELVQHPGMRVLLREAEAAVRAIQDDVLKYNLETGDSTRLTYLKCRAEGAAQLFEALKRRCEIKPPRPRK